MSSHFKFNSTLHISVGAASIDGSSIDTSIQCYHKYPNLPPPRSSDRKAVCIVCPETSDYRKLAVSHILRDDCVLEIGCSYGKATEIILKQTDRRVIAVDKNEEATNSTTSLCRDAIKADRLHVYCMDVLSNPIRCIQLGRELGDKITVFVDIGGNRDYPSVLSLVVVLLKELQPALMVVKCRELYAAAAKHEVSGDGNFWEKTLNDLKLQASAAVEEVPNPRSAPGETRICHAFLKKGICKHSRCVFRHLRPLHPDVIAYKQKLDNLQLNPVKVPLQKTKAVQSLASFDFCSLLTITLILLIVPWCVHKLL